MGKVGGFQEFNYGKSTEKASSKNFTTQAEEAFAVEPS